ncbi:MAG: sulfotransferase [Pseudomonadota bacterium]
MAIENFVLIVGAMKCGTTTLFDLLARHPQICPCKSKEPSFFAFEDRWAEGFSWYESLFEFDAKTHRYALDGSTDYTKFPFASGVVERLERSAPRKFKLIYLIRDPVDRMESHARHTQLRKRELGRALSPRNDHSLDQGVSPISLATSRYVDQLLQFRKHISEHQMLVLSLEDLSHQPDKTVNRVLDFLDLEPYEYHNIGPSNKFKDQKEIPNTVQAIRTIIPFRRHLRSLFGDEFIENVIDAWRRTPQLKGRFKFTEEERLALESSYHAEFELLSRISDGGDPELSSLLSELRDK